MCGNVLGSIPLGVTEWRLHTIPSNGGGTGGGGGGGGGGAGGGGAAVSVDI